MPSGNVAVTLKSLAMEARFAVTMSPPVATITNIAYMIQNTRVRTASPGR